MQALIIDHDHSNYNEDVINMYLSAVIGRLASRNEGVDFAELSIVFVSAERMQTINAEFRSKDYVTDVLSFASDDNESMGELVFCLEKLREQAEDNKHSLSLEFLYLLLHGLLHLLGYDHENELAAKKMFKIQDDIYATLRDSKLATFDCFNK